MNTFSSSESIPNTLLGNEKGVLEVLQKQFDSFKDCVFNWIIFGIFLGIGTAFLIPGIIYTNKEEPEDFPGLWSRKELASFLIGAGVVAVMLSIITPFFIRESCKEKRKDYNTAILYVKQKMEYLGKPFTATAFVNAVNREFKQLQQTRTNEMRWKTNAGVSMVLNNLQYRT